MKSLSTLAVTAILIGPLCVTSGQAAEPATAIVSPPNAALVYWQAFAQIPDLEEKDSDKFLDADNCEVPVSDELAELATEFDTVFIQMERARSIALCDWQLNYSEGPFMLLPHLAKGREVCRAALVRARVKFAAGERQEAVDELLTALKLGRDLASSPVLVCLLFDASIEKETTKVLAAYLPRLTKDELDRLAGELSRLPQSQTLLASLKLEGEEFGNWLDRRVDIVAKNIADPNAGVKALQVADIIGSQELSAKTDPASRNAVALLNQMTVADVRAMIKQLRADYQECVVVAALDRTKRARRWPELEARLAQAKLPSKREEVARYLCAQLVPAMAKLDNSLELCAARRGLLQLAIQVQRHGPEAIKAAGAYGRGAVEYKKTDTGFELRHRFTPDAEPEALVVGGAK